MRLIERQWSSRGGWIRMTGDADGSVSRSEKKRGTPRFISFERPRRAASSIARVMTLAEISAPKRFEVGGARIPHLKPLRSRRVDPYPHRDRLETFFPISGIDRSGEGSQLQTASMVSEGFFLFPSLIAGPTTLLVTVDSEAPHAAQFGVRGVFFALDLAPPRATHRFL